MLKEKKGLPYCTHIYANLRDPLALSWDEYVRSVPFMRYLVYFCGTVNPKLTKVYGIGTVEYYLDEWVCVVLTLISCLTLFKVEFSRRLWLKGVEINYMPMGPLMYSIAARNPTDETWLLVLKADAVMTTSAFFGETIRASGGDSTSPWAGLQAARVLKSVSWLTEQGKFIWPHPELMTIGARKSINTVLYGQSMVNAGGIGEGPVIVESKEIGIDMLQRGSHVIKSDWSFEYSSIFMPINSLDKSGRGARKTEKGPVQRFKTAWDEVQKYSDYPFAPCFFAIPYNDAIISLGEVRVYFVNGKIVDMLHTIPGVLDAPEWTVQRVSAARTAPVKNIK